MRTHKFLGGSLKDETEPMTLNVTSVFSVSVSYILDVFEFEMLVPAT